VYHHLRQYPILFFIHSSVRDPLIILRYRFIPALLYSCHGCYLSVIVSTWLPPVIVSIMSPPALPTPSGSPSSDLQADLILGARGHVKDELATRIEEQRAKIRAPELAVEKRRRADEVRIQERARETESIKQELRQRLLVA